MYLPLQHRIPSVTACVTRSLSLLLTTYIPLWLHWNSPPTMPYQRLAHIFSLTESGRFHVAVEIFEW
jgi:hypothetical protein